MKLNLKTIAIILGSIVFLIFLGALFYLIRYTSFLTRIIPASSSVNVPQLDLVDLKSTKIIVPDVYKTGAFSQDRTVNLPTGFQISVWAGGLGNPRAIAFTPANNLVVTGESSGNLYLIKNDIRSASTPQIITIDSGLFNPHGVDYYKGDLYVGESDQIDVYRNLKEDGTYSKKEVLIPNLPTDGHVTRTVLVGPDEKLYVAIGSSCNLCEETDPGRAAILRYNLDGSGKEIFASGLRNTVDFTFHDYNGVNSIWGVDNGRDNLGDDLPPEEVNIIQEGKNYGWPYCYGAQINNPEFPDRLSYCQTQTQAPLYQMQAHSAPLGLTFIPAGNATQQDTFPGDFANNLFITFHGSWNRSIPTGYKVVRIDTTSTQSKTIDFITGWLDSSLQVWGRPVGIRFDVNGNMFIADDLAGVIYKVTYVGN